MVRAPDQTVLLGTRSSTLSRVIEAITTNKLLCICAGVLVFAGVLAFRHWRQGPCLCLN